MDTTAHLETEVKFHLPSPGKIKKHIIDLGGRSQGKTFESNIRYDDSQGSLQAKGCLLRLRKDTAARLTYKKKPAKPVAGVKAYLEYEVVVEDFDTMDAILNQIGLRGVQRYEKIRETFLLANCTVCLDEMPFGSFIEIEGPAKDIARLAGRLGLAWEKRILANYLAIFEKLRNQAALAFNDVTFTNFRACRIDPALVKQTIESFQSGPGQF